MPSDKSVAWPRKLIGTRNHLSREGCGPQEVRARRERKDCEKKSKAFCRRYYYAVACYTPRTEKVDKRKRPRSPAASPLYIFPRCCLSPLYYIACARAPKTFTNYNIPLFNIRSLFLALGDVPASKRKRRRRVVIANLTFQSQVSRWDPAILRERRE